MHNQLRIVVAEDEPEMQDYLCEVLAKLGHQVIAVAEDGAELVAQARGLGPDLVIADIKMPGMTGLQAAEQLAHDVSVPVILVSAYHDAEKISAAVESHVMAYLVKPIKQADLENAIALAIWRHRDREVLTSELVQCGERERRRLARLLHDHLQQLLVAAKMEAGVAHAQARDAESQEALERLIDLLSQSLQASRSLTAEMSPTVLYQAGLVPALRWLAERMQRIYGLHVEVDAEPDVEPSCSELRIPLFDAARELLFNVVKHADVNEARVEVGRPDEDHLRLTVSDDGRGFDESSLERSGERDGGFGLMSVRRHVELIGGHFELHSAPGGGTRIMIEVRLGDPRAAEPCESPAGRHTGLAGASR
jgi:signal transduction histidine kinase